MYGNYFAIVTMTISHIQNQNIVMKIYILYRFKITHLYQLMFTNFIYFVSKFFREFIRYSSKGIQTYQINPSALTSPDIEFRQLHVVFDIKATGLSWFSNITEFSAYNGKDSFNVHIDPRQPISQKATDITRLSFCFQKNQMNRYGKEKDSVRIHQALLSFFLFFFFFRFS